MKMTIYELLGLVKDGEIEYEQKIKIDNETITVSNLLGAYIFDKKRLNDEVEILEEKKITPTDFENLGYALGSIQKYINKGYDKAIKEKKIPNKWEEPAIKGMKSSNSFEELVPYIETIMRTQNDILDYLKSKGE